MVILSRNVLQKRLIYQKYKKKNSSGKYAWLLNRAISIRWISVKVWLPKMCPITMTAVTNAVFNLLKIT